MPTSKPWVCFRLEGCTSLTLHDPQSHSTPFRAWDQVLSNPYINASTSGFLGNWYISFNLWAASQTNLTQVRGLAP